MLPTTGCSKLNIEIFGVKIGGNDEEEKDESLFQNNNDVEIKEVPGHEDYGNSYDTSANNSIQNDFNNISDNDQPYNYYPFINIEKESYKNSNLELPKQREYSLEDLKYFKDEHYLLAEYYLNKIKDEYGVGSLHYSSDPNIHIQKRFFLQYRSLIRKQK